MLDPYAESGRSEVIELEVLFAGDTHGATAHVDYLLRTAEADHPELKFVAAVQPGRSARAA